MRATASKEGVGLAGATQGMRCVVCLARRLARAHPMAKTSVSSRGSSSATLSHGGHSPASPAVNTDAIA